MNEVENTAKNLLELSSEQRLGILKILQEKKAKLSTLAKELDATSPEIHRNLDRLVKSDLIQKNSEGYFEISTFGKTVYTVIPMVSFFSNNKKYFQDHSFGNLPIKFIQRSGSLSSAKQIKGISNIFEQWKEIFDNAKKYLYGILHEEPLDLIEPIVKRAEKGINVKSIFSQDAIIPKGRKELLEKLGLSNLIEHGHIERKMKKGVQVIVVLNEKESCVMFPFKNDEIDMTNMFYGKEKEFHQWCLDYFWYNWYGSESFRESKVSSQ